MNTNVADTSSDFSIRLEQSVSDGRCPGDSATYQAHESVTVIMLLLTLPTIALTLGAKLLAHSVRVHNLWQYDCAVKVRGSEWSILQAQCGVS